MPGPMRVCGGGSPRGRSLGAAGGWPRWWVDSLVAGGSGDAEGRGGGGNLVFPRGVDAVVLAGFVAREELLVSSAGALIHHVEVAIEVGAEFEADAVALGEHEARIDDAPGIAVEAFEHEFHAVCAFGHGTALRSPERRGEAQRGREAAHWCTRWRWATTRELAMPVGLTT